jgi:hypothetical protein
MLFRSLGLSVVLAAMGCGSSGSEGDAPTGHTLTMNAKLNAVNGELSFVTPAAAIEKVPVANVVGKPYLIASFPAGFSPGNDPALDWTWGTVPASLELQYTTPAHYKDGPYDMVVVVYTTTAVSDAVKSGNAVNAPAAVHGDLATFTIDTSAVRPGDPKIPAGVVRLVVDAKDAAISVENRAPTDPNDQEQLKHAFDNVLMIVP